jgi:hypothetical protein
MRSQKVYVKPSEVKYHYNLHRDETGRSVKVPIGIEKQTDVSIAVDLLTLAYTDAYDVAVIFSQDSDLIPAVNEIHAVARMHQRDVFIASAFPSDSGNGIARTKWIEIPEEIYRNCQDERDYRRGTLEDDASF